MQISTTMMIIAGIISKQTYQISKAIIIIIN